MNNRQKKQQKSTHMSADKLRSIRLEIGVDMKTMASMLDSMPYRTYQDYEYSNRPIPENVAGKVNALLKREVKFMRDLKRKIAADIDRSFPRGIPSESLSD